MASRLYSDYVSRRDHPLDSSSWPPTPGQNSGDGDDSLRSLRRNSGTSTWSSLAVRVLLRR
ncbi:hypothetical protein M6B38_402095 [Iris pallida]|uniref:Uncharacterized protein n=1 Tax=Iris pallida TaxID=29817 RepID=A0AAX6FT21_IRIPA|nr:hypothetical protein M6B38_402095 [Iris pallida]